MGAGVIAKTINLKRDPIFQYAVPLNENRDYIHVNTTSAAVIHRANAVRERIASLERCGKLDAIDLQIIVMRQLSPVPTWREIGNALHMTKQAAHGRAQKIKESINKGLSH